jgi:hypothetical protein
MYAVAAKKYHQVVKRHLPSQSGNCIKKHDFGSGFKGHRMFKNGDIQPTSH